MVAHHRRSGTIERLDTRRKRWTRSEYDALLSSDVLVCPKLELIDGDLIDKKGKKRPHVVSLRLLANWLRGVFGDCRVSTEAPIDVAAEDNRTSEPEPDLAVLKRDDTEFRSNPQAEDLHLVVEISDFTIAFDRTTKAALYARAGIVEYWVLDIPGRRMIVHRDPEGRRYTSVQAYSEEESVSPLAAPTAALLVRDVIPE
jgi:Uma2 family endonuclease